MSAIRLSSDLTAAIDRWAAKTGVPSRSEAIRRLIEQGLAGSQPLSKRSKESASEARKMAHRALDSLADKSLPLEEHEKRLNQASIASVDCYRYNYQHVLRVKEGEAMEIVEVVRMSPADQAVSASLHCGDSIGPP